jgi:autotransporter-associated beta strand protein
MKVVMKKSLCFVALSNSLMALVVCGLLAQNAGAQPVTTNYYCHVNGTGPGYGINANDNLSWDDMIWATTNATGAPDITWAVGSTPTGPGFARFNSTTTPYTITVNNTEINAGLIGASGVTLTINAAGSGNLSVVPNATLTAGLPTQGFFTGGGTVIVNAPITGTGGINIPTGGGNVELFGNNTYSGGTSCSSSATLATFNNNNSFGTGPINLNSSSASFANLLSTGGSAGTPLTITLANTWTNFTGGFVNFGSAAFTPVICTGPWYLGTFNSNIRNNGNTSASLTLNGAINGSGTLTFSGNNGGTIILGGASKYTGKTLIAGGSNIPGVGIIMSVTSINKVSGGSATSNLGAPTTVANGTIGIGNSTFTSTLIYTGVGETSDRVIDMPGTTGGAKLQADGTGALVLTANNTATGVGAKTLTLQGSNTGANSIGKIVDSSLGATAVVKAQGGSWKLTGANTYTGGTTVNAGILEISGSVVGGVTNNGGTLKLDSNSTMPSSSSLSLSSAGSVNLNFSGVQSITALIIDGTSEPLNTTWGAPGSGAQNENPIFTGSGIILVSGSPIITQQPLSQAIFPDTTFTFSVAVIGDPSFTYQWKKGGVNLAGANGSTLTISPAEASDAGVYTVWITNTFGFTNSQPATLTILPTNSYVNTVRADNPISYWRLDETNGTVAFDGISANNGVYNNINLNQSGYAVTDSDPAIGVPGSGSPRGYMQVTNGTPFVINGGSVFTFECWAYFTNLTTKGRLFSTLNLANPNGYAFGTLPGGAGLELTSGAVADNDITLGSPLVAGQWYHLACTCDGNSYTFYLNGAPVGAIAVSGHAPNGTLNRLQLGANPPSYTTGGSDGGAEQVNGRIDEAAFYNYALSQNQVTNHFTARYATLAPPIVFAPIVNPPTNYETLSATLQADAAGTALTYQWYKAPSTLLSGKTDATLTLSPLQSSDGGNYYVQVSNPAGTSNSPTSTLTVLPIPNNASQLNVTNGLVLHLPFDSDYADISGRGNDGTNVGASLIAGIVGAQALHYETAITPGVTNYVTLGVRPDLKFSSNVDFTVSYWVRQPNGSAYTNLPFFGDATGSTGSGSGGNLGFVFAPYETAISAGGWQLAIGGSVGSMSSPSVFTTFPDSNLINDGTWHHLVHVGTRAANIATYLDGTQVDSEAISFIGNIDNNNAATIGQDPTGAYPVAAQADLDDLGVWRRTLTSLEISGIYLAGSSNHVSFAPPVNPLVRAALEIVQVSPGQYQIIWTGGGTLKASGDVSGTYTNVPSGTSPYTIPISSSPQLFYRLKY